MIQDTEPREDGPEEHRARQEQHGGGEAGTGQARAEKQAPDERTRAERDAERRRRRAVFLRELHEARELRARVQPRRARAARMRQALRLRSFRW
jgi:hypothetical protein